MIRKPDSYPGWITNDDGPPVWVTSERMADMIIPARLDLPIGPRVDPPGTYHGIPICVCDIDRP